MFTEFGTHDDKTRQQMLDVASRAEYAALMADGHFGYVMPIGGVAAYDNKVSVVGVGFDIACGNMACRTDYHVNALDLSTNPTAEEIRNCEHLQVVADHIFNTFAFGVGRVNDHPDAPTDDPIFDDPRWDLIPAGNLRTGLREKARRQLGTVGSGNHYIDILVDEDGYIWSGVHFGSRGFGHTVASNFLALSQGGEWGDRGKEVEVLLDLDVPLGHDYWHLMNLAGRYAYAGREWAARRAARLFGKIEDEIHNHHNFAWKEKHYGRELIVVRKGATPAQPGQRGFVGGSMGDDAVILQGTPFDLGMGADIGTIQQQRSALFSTVHGAGRVMGRMEAKGKVKKGRVVREGKIKPEDMRAWLDERGVLLRGGGLDEAPQAYRRLPDVLDAQGSTVEVLHTLRPLIVCMAP